MTPERIKIVLDCLRDLSREYARHWNPRGNDDGLKGIHNLGMRHCLEDAIILIQEAEAIRCADCGKLYRDFPLDIVLPDDQWALLSGRNDGGGILCASCIVERASKMPGITVAKMTLE